MASHGSAQLLTIGQFSRLTDLSRPTLRRYDELGLLRPAIVDDDTGYRYYSVAQLDVAETIRLLRDLDVPIVEIDKMLAADQESLLRLLADHRRRMGEVLERQTAILARVEQTLARGLTLVPQSHEIIVRALEEMTVVSIRGESGPSLEELTAARAACEARLAQRFDEDGLVSVGPPITLHDVDPFAPWYTRARFQVCAPLHLSGSVPDDAWLLPGCTAAFTIHLGPRDGLRASWAALLAWIERSDYVAKPPVRTTYLAGGEAADDPASDITHIALPVIRPGA